MCDIMANTKKILKKLRKSTAMKEAYTLDYNKDGTVQINIGLKDSEDFFSPYSYKSYELMSPGIIDYINMYEASIPVSEDISIDIHTENPTTTETKKRIKLAVKRHHAEELVLINKTLKRRTLLGLLYTLIGASIILFEAFAWSFLEKIFLESLLTVVAWFFTWCGIEILLGDRSELKRKQIRSYRIMNAKVHVRQYSKKIKREYGIGMDEIE